MTVWILKSDEGADGDFVILGVFSSKEKAEEYATGLMANPPGHCSLRWFGPDENLEEWTVDDPDGQS